MSDREEPAATETTTLERIIGERRDKAERLRASGRNPFTNQWKPSNGIADVRARYEPTRPPPPTPEEIAANKAAAAAAKAAKAAGAAPAAEADAGIHPIDNETIRVAGRVLAKRGFGKTVFAPIRDGSADIQLYLNVDAMDGDDFANVMPELDAGDFVGAEGTAFWTKRGELSILVSRLTILTKSLRPLPDKWHGLSDIELRYRQRYVDLAISPDVRAVFQKRSRIVRGIRSYLDERGFLEVETPMMHPIVGGAAARPFVTHHNALDMKLFMRIAPELYLKRLVVGGMERVYEINRNFRNEGLSRRHNPEFTMLEFYWAYATFVDLMDLTENMVRELSLAVNGTTTVTWDGVEVDLGKPWQRLSVKNAVGTLGKVADVDRVFNEPGFAAETAIAHGVPAADVLRALLEGAADYNHTAETLPKFKDPSQRAGIIAAIVKCYADVEAGRIRAGHLGYLLFEKTAEDKLVQPTFLTDFPVAVSPLARKREDDPAFCDRFELFVCGKEIANGFSELNDPDDQRSRFAAQMRAKAAGADETMDYDEDYCRALEIGMPPTAGEGIGIDRLAMLLTGQSSIRDVILFPLMRPE